MVTEEARRALADWLKAHLIPGTAFTFLEASAFHHPSLRWLDDGRPRIVPRVGCHPVELPGLSLAATDVPRLALRVLYPDTTLYQEHDSVHLLVIDLGGAQQTIFLRLQGAEGARHTIEVALGPQGAATVTLADLPPGPWQVAWQDGETSSPDPAPCRFTITARHADLADVPRPRSAAGMPGSSPPASHPSLFTSLARHDVLGGLEPAQGARVVRGLHLSHGAAVHDWPLELERVDTARARLRATRDVEAACVVVVDPLSRPPVSAEPCQVLRDLVRDQVVEVEVPSPAGLLLVGASVAGSPFEGAAVTLGPESMACRVALPRDPHAGEALDVVVHARGLHVAEAVAHVVVKDIRLDSAPSPLSQLAAALHAFAASHGFRTRTPRRPFHAVPRQDSLTMPTDMEEFLVAQGLVTERQRNRVQEEARTHGHDFVTTALELEFFSEEELGRALASWMGVAFFDLDHEIVDAGLTGSLDPELAHRHGGIPVQRQGDSLYVALPAPLDQRAVHELADSTGLDVVPLLATGPAVRRALHRFYGSDATRDSREPLPHQPCEATSLPQAPQGHVLTPVRWSGVIPPRVLHAGLLALGGGVGRLSLVLPRELATYRVEAFVFCGKDWCEATTTFSARP